MTVIPRSGALGHFSSPDSSLRKTFPAEIALSIVEARSFEAS